ncbi:MAG: UvrD-helicase domain-containing protein, partial [Anaerolineae bacterium]|nr:UvrD-helicase domain-containing protein [Anaerolineae bacterium]
MPNPLLDILNPQQREAVTAGDGPVLVLAGPGSGKTRVLTHRIAYLIQDEGIAPYHIVAVTFTNKAAAEMRERVQKLLGGDLSGLQIGTFHSICARLLRIEADHTPYDRDYVIYDTDDQIAVLKNVIAEMNVDPKKFKPGGVLNAISTAKNELIEPGEYIGRDYFGEIVARVYPEYQRRLVASNALDFDDLLMQTVLLLRDHPDVREKYQQRYEHILVDEFQDTNQAQYQLVQVLASPQENVLVVGDEDQGIYAFRGADYRNVMQFRRDYPGARVILLEQNYRSTQVVLDTARAIIDKNSHRTPKALFTDREGGALVTIYEAYSEGEEGDFIVNTINRQLKRGEYTARDFAVMYRTNAQSRSIEEAFIKYGVSYKLVGGVGFYKRREIRDLVAYLRVINNPNESVSFERVINVPGRGIGAKSLETFNAWAFTSNMTTAEALDALLLGTASPLTGRAAKAFAEFALMLNDLRMLAEHNDLTVVFDELLGRIGYNLYISEISETKDETEDRMENIAALRGLISDKKDLALTDFLAETALVSDIDTLDQEKDSVTLLTMHAAKGLEFPVVFITGLEDGLLPHSRSFSEPDAMAEERRLLYVGLTRAKDHLYLTYAFRRSLYGESVPGIPSRFLGDIPAELTEGVSPRLQTLRDRAGYQAATSWSYDKPSAAPVSSSKVISFERAAQKQRNTRYKAGQRVFHPKFGEGIVIDSRPDGQD